MFGQCWKLCCTKENNLLGLLHWKAAFGKLLLLENCFYQVLLSSLSFMNLCLDRQILLMELDGSGKCTATNESDFFFLSWQVRRNVLFLL